MQVTLKRAPTGDRGPPGGDTITVDILTTEQLGPKMSMLPNGSLLCRDVPIARVGWMIYGPGETPVKVGDTGVAYVERTADDLFSPETIGSFMAATVTDNHPPDSVIPGNWKDLAKGFATTNVRRGTGDNADVLLADLVITDAALIAQVRAGKREVSCGYEADYFQTGPGMGRQANILGNHIALVEKGRCGPRCAIGDRASTPATEKGKTMTERVKLKTPRRVLAEDPAIELARKKVADAAAELEELEQQTGEEENGAVHIHLHSGAEEPPKGEKASTSDKRLDAIEATVTTLASTVETLVAKLTPTADQAAAAAAAATAAEALAKAKTGDADGEGDSKALADGYTKVLAQAEVLVPGFRMPTFDAAAKRKVTIDQMCQARRKCLELAHITKDGQDLIDGVAGAPLDLEKMDCAAVAVIFNAAATLKAASNNRSATGDSGAGPGKQEEVKPVPQVTAASVNDANAKFWAAQEKANQSTPA